MRKAALRTEFKEISQGKLEVPLTTLAEHYQSVAEAKQLPLYREMYGSDEAKVGAG